MSGLLKAVMDLARATETAPARGHGKWWKTLFVAERMHKHLQTHIEVLKLCITKSANK